ncbi:MAG: TIGR02281 family clan AA aspartic protease [Burkholderiales bacterium]|nr:TIGR02281 family clan AA aspartic protease [Burkholderiales bacterium]
MRIRPADLSLALLLVPWSLHAAQVQVIALTEGKATLVIDNAKPRTLAAGQVSPEGVRLIAATPESAIVEIDGKRSTLVLGAHYRMAPESAASSPVGRVVIAADAQGHFLVSGTINGAASVRFLVDTGATLVSIDANDARRAGVNYLAGKRSHTQTANGIAPVYRVKLDTLKVGDITLYNVDAVVHVGGHLPIGLLGMSFLNRMEMKRDGAALTLTRRF